jgi:hypothetical protein
MGMGKFWATHCDREQPVSNAHSTPQQDGNDLISSLNPAQPDCEARIDQDGRLLFPQQVFSLVRLSRAFPANYQFLETCCRIAPLCDDPNSYRLPAP